MVSHVPGFVTFWLYEIADNANSSFSVGLEGISLVWLKLQMGQINVILTGLIYEMKSQGDTNLGEHINTPLYTVWLEEQSGVSGHS